MTDDEIHEYLIKHNWVVNSHEFISIMNESPQIERTEYNSQNDILTVYTYDHVFLCKWVLNEIKEN
jgi:hypothetical protein